MLVDNPLLQPFYFAAPSAQSSYADYSTDFSDIFDTDLFNSTFATPSSTSSGSRGSSPQNLLTPPQDVSPASFPEILDDDAANQFYALFDDDLKAMNNPLALPSTSADFMATNGFDGSYDVATGRAGVDYNIGYGMGLDVSNMGINIPPIDDSIQMAGIDPHLVDTPSAVSDQDEEQGDEQEAQSPPDVVNQPEQEKLTFTIAPVKVGGFGKARKGTVQSGGIVKKTSSAYANKDKENPSTSSLPSYKKSAPSKVTKLSLTSLPNITSSGLFLTGDSTNGGSEAGDHDDDDDLPQDWRPSPEVLAKMTSKEKRQLRNKISARNFRVRRKEYISTLEGDIAERDRLLDYFRTQLGSQESENLALRQEVAALKKALLDGRGGSINLPPPAPLPQQSAAETLATSNTNINTSIVQSSPLLTPNTQKDLPTSSPRMGGPRFWMGGGVTPVHTTLVPDISTIVRNGLQENMNPALNAMGGTSATSGIGPNKALGQIGGFDGFADLNPFTMKTLDAYRMHLWSKMAAQQQIHQQNQTRQSHQNHSGLASNMRPHHFFAASPKANQPPSSGYGSTLSALLSGKHNPSSASSYPTPPSSPLLTPKGGASLPLLLFNPLSTSPSSSATTTPSPSSSQKEQQHAILAAMASQTIFRKLGNAFWDAFTGSSSSSSSASSSRGDWDADKVRRVLEGKAVLRVVDVEPAAAATASSAVVSTSTAVTLPASPKLHHSWVGAASRSSFSQARSTMTSTPSSCRTSAVCEMLEESMRGLSLGKK